MRIELRRAPVVDKALPGELFIDGARFSWTLENAAKAIPAGRYPVSLTESQRVQDGQLWTPDTHFRLPLVNNVPGRSGIRFHSLNEYHESDGCIGVGENLTGAWLGRSRAALTRFLPLIDVAQRGHEAIWLTVLDAPKPGSETKVV